MNNKIPLISIILGITLIIGGGIFVWKYSGEQALFGQNELKQNFKDSDNDGLMDWEEQLYGTDLNNPDTDGDGYLDGEEVDSGHNPLVEAPGDRLVFYPLPLGEKYNVTKKVLTDEAISELFNSYITQKGQYVIDHPEVDSPEAFSAMIDQSTIKKMAERSMAEIYSNILEESDKTINNLPEIFDINVFDSQINISDDNSEEAIKLYLSQVSSILSSDIFFLQEQTLGAVVDAFKNDSFSKLDQLIIQNDAKIKQAKDVLVPSSWKEIHKTGLELTIKIRNIFISLRDYQEDPLKARLAVQELENFSDIWNSLMDDAIDLANEQGLELSL